jgi:hypothetical protein
MIKLKKRNTDKHTVDIGDGIFFELGYPTLAQKEILDQILFEIGEVDTSTEDEITKRKLQAYGKYLTAKYMKYYVRYHVKGWIDKKADTRKDGESLPEFKLTDNQMSFDLWEELTADPNQLVLIYSIIEKATLFDEADKKK